MTGGWMRPRFNRPSLARMAREVDARVLRFQLDFELRLSVRRQLAARGPALPTALYLETSSYCEGACADCYVPAAARRQHLELDAGLLYRLLAEAERLPLAYVCVVGGEPLDHAIVERNLRLVRDHPRTRFLICTSGEAEVDAALARELGALRNLSLLVSFEGSPETHRRVRPRGSFARARATLDAYRRASRSFCGASVTLRADNWEEVTGRDFVGQLSDAGCHFLVYAPCETSGGVPALGAEVSARAVERLTEVSAASAALIYCHPFGQLLGGRITPVPRLRSLTVDYAGNVYTARRGPSYGNVHDEGLVALIARPALQAAYRGASEPAPGPLPAPASVGAWT